MEGLFSNYGWSKDKQAPFDYNDPKNRKEIEQLDLRDLEDFLREFSSEEGLKNSDEVMNHCFLPITILFFNCPPIVHHFTVDCKPFTVNHKKNGN